MRAFHASLPRCCLLPLLTRSTAPSRASNTARLSRRYPCGFTVGLPRQQVECTVPLQSPQLLYSLWPLTCTCSSTFECDRASALVLLLSLSCSLTHSFASVCSSPLCSQMHVPRLHETLLPESSSSKRIKAVRSSPPSSALRASHSSSSLAAVSTPAIPASPYTPVSKREQRYIEAQHAFSQLIESPPAAASSATPRSLPVSLLPFHRAFQTDGWRLALATPEDRFTGRHVCTSLFALLWHRRIERQRLKRRPRCK